MRVSTISLEVRGGEVVVGAAVVGLSVLVSWRVEERVVRVVSGVG